MHALEGFQRLGLHQVFEAMFLLVEADGGDGVHGFAFTLIIGVLVGTYSSVAIAAPILLFGKKKNGQPAPKPAVG